MYEPDEGEELGDGLYKAECILDSNRFTTEDGGQGTEYLVRWAGWGPEEDRWLAEDQLEGCRDLIDRFEQGNGASGGSAFYSSVSTAEMLDCAEEQEAKVAWAVSQCVTM